MKSYNLTDEGTKLLSEWFIKKREKEGKSIRFKLSDLPVPIGERALIFVQEGNAVNGPVYFGVRTSQNYYRSGSTTIPDSDKIKAIWLKDARKPKDKI